MRRWTRYKSKRLTANHFMEEFTLDLIPDIDIEPLYLPEVPKEKNTPPVMSSILQVEMMVQDLRERVKHLEIMHERRQLFPLPLI